MKTLGLFRHAKSDWTDSRARDFDRVLNARGRAGAAVVGRYIADDAQRWDRVIASPAVRSAQTIEIALEAAAGINTPPPIVWDRRVYLASSASLIDLVREADDRLGAILLVGHNPGLEDVIFDLVPAGSGRYRDMVEEKFPTAAYAVLRIDAARWADLGAAPAELVALTRPRDLDPALGPERVG